MVVPPEMVNVVSFTQSDPTDMLVTLLAVHARRIGYRCRIGLYHRKYLEELAEMFLQAHELTSEEVQRLYDWTENLPWNEAGFLAVIFRW